MLARLAESDIETLSLAGHGLLHFGLKPDNDWVRAYLRETLFKMEQVWRVPRGHPTYCMALCMPPLLGLGPLSLLRALGCLVSLLVGNTTGCLLWTKFVVHQVCMPDNLKNVPSLPKQ